MKKLFCLVLTLVLALSFTAFAVDFTCLSTTVENNAADVYVKEGKITFSFSDTVDATTLASITMGKDGEPFDGFTATLNGTTAIDINFTNDLEYSMPYVIYLSGVKNTSGASIIGMNLFSFTTEAEPAINVKSVILTKGIGSAVDEVSVLAADNTIQGFKVEVENKAAEEKTVNLICVLFKTSGIIDKVIVSEREIDASSTEVVEVGTVITSACASGKAKIYIWDSVSNKSPFVGSITYNIP